MLHCVESGEMEFLRTTPWSRNRQLGLQYSSRHFRLYFCDFGYGEVDGHVCRQPSGTEELYTTEQALVVGIIMILLRDGENTLGDVVSYMGRRLVREPQ
jgi:hypothetical protein